MTDLEKVQAMRDANWTPAVQYWKRRADEALEALKNATVHMNAASAALRADGVDDLWLDDFEGATERARDLIIKHSKGRA